MNQVTIETSINRFHLLLVVDSSAIHNEATNYCILRNVNLTHNNIL